MPIDYLKILAKYPQDMYLDDLVNLGFIEDGQAFMRDLHTGDVPPFTLRFEKKDVIKWVIDSGLVPE